MERKVYDDDRRIPMTAYMGPRRAGKRYYKGVYGTHPMDPEEGFPSYIRDDVFEDYKAAGLSFLMPEGDAFFGKRLTKDGFVEEPDFEKSDLYQYMSMAKKHGLGVYPTMHELFDDMTHGKCPFGEKEKAELKHFIKTVQAYFPETFQGIMLTDEPSYELLDRVKEIVEYLQSDEIKVIKPDLDIFASMLPMYGAMRTFSPNTTEEKYQKMRNTKERKDAYHYYIEKCARATGEISIDYYSLIYETGIAPSYYLNLEIAAEIGKKMGCPLTLTLQSQRLDEIKNQQTGRSRIIYRTPLYNDMRWQTYSALAFGVKRLGYYTFWTHYDTGGAAEQKNTMVVYDLAEESGYRKTEIYQAVKEVNREILAFDHVFLRFDWQGCRVIKKSRERNIRMVHAGYEGGTLKAADGTRDTLIGCMQNPEDGAEGYWVVNADNPSWCMENDVELVFENADRCIYYRKGKEYDVSLTRMPSEDSRDGKFSIRLGVGEGVFVIPYQKSE